MRYFKLHRIFLFCALVVPAFIYSANIYSRKTGNWTDNSGTGTWSTASLGGAGCSCVPGSTDNVIIGGSNTVTYDVGVITTINALQVNVSSKLTITASRLLTINTSVTLNGTIDGAGTRNIEYAASGPSTLSGTGTYSTIGAGDLKMLNNVTIPVGSDLKFNNLGRFNLGGFTVTNNGKVQILNPSDLSNALGSAWINAASTSYLYYASNTNFGGNNILTSTAVGNTVEFAMASGSPTMDITGRYYHLVISGAGGTKRLRTDAVVAGNLTINAGVTNVFDVNFRNITIAGNFTNNGTFIVDTQSVTLNGTSAQQIAGAGTAFYDLTISNTYATSPQITLGANTIVQRTLSMTQGNVNLNGYTLTLGTATVSPGTLNHTSGFLYGSTGTFTRWIAATSAAMGAIASNQLGHFPMGSSSGNYRPLWLSYTADLTAGGTVSVRHDPTILTTLAIHNDASWSGGTILLAVSNSSWTVSSANGFALSGTTGTLRYGGQGYGSFLLTDLNASLLASVVGSYSATTSSGTVLEVNRTTLTTANLANTWRIGTKNNGNSPLPIELLLFKAIPSFDKKVDLKWTTATEINNDFFIVEKSVDGINFENVGNVNGAGNSSSALKYSLVDDNPYEGVSYYRLKQTDFDGKYSYSSIIDVNIDNNSVPFSFSLFPNPSSDGILSINFTSSSNKEVLVVVYDVFGKEVYSKVIVIQNANTTTAIDHSNKLAPGTYFVILISDNNLYKQKLIVN